MESHAGPHHGHRCSFPPDRTDAYLRLGTVTLFVRDQERSLKFFLDQLGFRLAFDEMRSSGDRWLAVTPPDGTAVIELVAPKPATEEYGLIGHSSRVSFVTEDIFAKFDEWRARGVRFHHPPRDEHSGAQSATFEDVDGNVFKLVAHDRVTREIDEQRRAHVEMRESQRHANRELEIAKETQARLLPQVTPSLGTLRCHAVCLQARQVGGDYYDFLDLGRGLCGLVVADVSGKGTPAALLMANLQAHLHNLSDTYLNRPYTPFALEQPARFLHAVNRLFYENTPENAYATLFFAEYDDINRQLKYANCGHPPALLIRANGEIERLESTGTVLGLTKSWDCGVGERRLYPGDVLALYTDGVTEAVNEAEEEFGEARLIEALHRYRGEPADELLQLLAKEVKQFSPNDQHDDITLVVAQCTGEAFTALPKDAQAADRARAG